MKNKISILRVFLLTLISIIVIFIIVFPIALRKIINERKIASIAKGYQFIEMINKRNLFNINIIDDGDNIPVSKIKTSIKNIDGQINVNDGIIVKADLVIDGYKFNYVSSNDDNNVNEKKEILYYIDENDKLKEPDISWKVYVKRITEYRKNYRQSEHILNYIYHKKEYSLVLDNEKECKIIMKKLSKTKDFSNITCKLKHKMILRYEQVCSVFNDDIICFDSNSWNNAKLVKKQVEEVTDNNVKCNLNKDTLLCYNEDDLKMSITKKGDLTVSRSNDENKITCSLSKNKNAKCLNAKE